MSRSSATGRCEESNAALAECIAYALKKRGDDEVMFALVARDPQDTSSEPVSATQLPSGVEVTITKRLWLCFVQLLHERLSQSQSVVHPPLPLPQAACELHSRASCCDVGLYCSDTFYACVAESACLLLGMSFCPFRPDDPPLRLSRLEQQRRPRCKLYTEDICLLLKEATALTQGSTEATTQDAPYSSFPTAEALLKRTSRVADDVVAYYIHTSGSTGDPKCVVASRGNLRAYLHHFVLASDGLGVVTELPCRLLCLSSPFFDPSVGDTLTALCCPHATLYACAPDTVLNGRVGEVVAAVQPTHIVSTPAVWRSVSLPSAVSASMKVFLGGERMPQALISTWASLVELYNIYGVTEATIYQSVRRVPAGALASEVTCGSGVGTRIAVDVSTPRDSSRAQSNLNDEEAEDGAGEVVLYGDQVCCGYAEELQESSTAAPRDGAAASFPFGYDPVAKQRFFRTGDLGRIVPGHSTDEKPQLALRGRRDWQLKLNGQRVSMEEVEGTVQRALGGVVEQCACFCIKSPAEPLASASPSPLIGAAVVCAGVSSAQLLREHRGGVVDALQELLALHLPAFMMPRRWLLYACGGSLPQTATGKVNRAELAALSTPEPHENSTTAVEDAAAMEEASQLRDDLYNAVRAVWEQHLGVSVHAETHYLHAGGDSLGALKLTRAVFLRLHNGCDDGIDEHGGLPAPYQPCVLFQHPRLGDYVEVLRDAHAAASPSHPGKEGEGKGSETHTPPTNATVGSPSLPSTGRAPLHTSGSRFERVFRDVVAARYCSLAERLLQHGLVDVNGHNTREHRCVTPLHIAVAGCCDDEVEGRIEDVISRDAALRMVQLLLRHGARLTAVTPDGVTPAHLAATKSATALRCLLEHDPSVAQCRDGRQQSLLHFAARSGIAGAVHLLLCAYGLKLDTRDKWQRTPVHWAVLNGHLVVLEEMNTFYTASVAAAAAAASQQEASEVDTADMGLKRRRAQGHELARRTRLARKKTYLAYETLRAIAERTLPGDQRLLELCDALSAAVGEQPTPP